MPFSVRYFIKNKLGCADCSRSGQLTPVSVRCQILRSYKTFSLVLVILTESLASKRPSFSCEVGLWTKPSDF